MTSLTTEKGMKRGFFMDSAQIAATEKSSTQSRIIGTLYEAFETKNLDSIKKSVSDVQRFFIDSLLEDSASETLEEMGRELSKVVLKHLSPSDQADREDKYYIAQLSTIASISDYIARAQPRIEEIQAATSTSYGPRIIDILHHRGATTASELVSKIEMPHKSQLSATVAKLIDAGLVRQERYGKNIWYSLTARGTLLAMRYFQFQPKWALNVRFLLAEILRRSKDAKGTHPNELMEDLKHQLSLSDETVRQVITDVLSVLSANKVVTKTSDDRYIFVDWDEIKKKLLSLIAEVEKVGNGQEIIEALSLYEQTKKTEGTTQEYL